MSSEEKGEEKSVMGLYGLGVMGQNFALNVAEKGFRISVFNRTLSKVDDCVARAKEEGVGVNLEGFKDIESFVDSLESPRRIMFLVKAGDAVDETIEMFSEYLESGDILIDGGNEWYENSQRRAKDLETRGILYLAMGVSGGEYGARHGPSLMPGGPKEAFDAMEPVLRRVAAQVDGAPCTTHVGAGGAGNYVKMVHNGIEYGDMQLIAEAYDLLRAAGLSNGELSRVFAEWNKAELNSFLVEITATILAKDDRDVEGLRPGEGQLVDKILDSSGNKGTGKMTVKEGAERGVAVPTIAAALEQRFISTLKEERIEASSVLRGPAGDLPSIDRAQLIEDVRHALYASKICSYAQGMNLIRAASDEFAWGVNLGECARIWKGGCIIRAQFLDRIKSAYDRNAALPSLLVDPDFTEELMERQAAWRRIVSYCTATGQACPAICASLQYFDTYRRPRLPANLIQAQRDFFGSHTFERVDQPRGKHYHCRWTDDHA